MNTTGRKVGTCDAVATRKEQRREGRRDEEAGRGGRRRRRRGGEGVPATSRSRIAPSRPRTCSTRDSASPASATPRRTTSSASRLPRRTPRCRRVCGARVAEFCKRLQTPDGFMKANGRENAAQMCGVSVASIKAAHCPKGAQIDSLAFLGAYCPVEAKPIAQEHCIGRDYTSKMGGKYARFCENYLANADFEQPSGSAARSSAPASATAPASCVREDPGAADRRSGEGRRQPGHQQVEGPVRQVRMLRLVLVLAALAAGAARAAEDPYPWIAAAYVVKRDGALLWAGRPDAKPAAGEPRQADDRAPRARARQSG